MVLIVQDYDASSSTISQARTMEVRSSNLRSWRQVLKKWCRTIIKKTQVGQKNKTAVFACN